MSASLASEEWLGLRTSFWRKRGADEWLRGVPRSSHGGSFTDFGVAGQKGFD